MQEEPKQKGRGESKKGMDIKAETKQKERGRAGRKGLRWRRNRSKTGRGKAGRKDGI